MSYNKNPFDKNEELEQTKNELNRVDDLGGMDDHKIEDILMSDETLLWQGKPKKEVYILEAVLKMLPIALIWGAIDFGFIYAMLKFNVGVPWYVYLFFAVHLLPVWMWVAHIVRAVMSIKNISYAITDKRIIIRSGIVVDLDFVYYTDINDVRVKVGIVERMFKVGDVVIRSNLKSYCLDDVTNPYKLGNYVQKVVQDIKTDIEFPNAYRPEENPGFNTKYKNIFDQNDKRF